MDAVNFIVTHLRGIARGLEKSLGRMEEKWKNGVAFFRKYGTITTESVPYGTVWGETMGKHEKNTLFLLRGLTEEEAARCWQMAQSEECAYSKGQVVYDAGLARPALALVLEGNLRVLHGKVVMNDLHPGDVFGAAALFGGGEPYPSTVVAASACRVLLIPQETVTAWMAAVPQVGENYVRFLSDRIRFLNRRLSTLTAGQTDGKLWRYLVVHSDDAGVVRLPGGMTGLAECLDMGRSSLYRCLDSLTAQGKIRREGKTIVIINREEE